MFNAYASLCPIPLGCRYEHGSRLNCRKPGRLLVFRMLCFASQRLDALRIYLRVATYADD